MRRSLSRALFETRAAFDLTDPANSPSKEEWFCQRKGAAKVGQQAEEMLARLVELSEVRTAFLLNPAGKVSTWKGAEAQEQLQRFCDTRSDLSGPVLAQGLETGQKMFVTFAQQQSA